MMQEYGPGSSDDPAKASADAVANRAVLDEGAHLSAAFESGNVADIEQSFYRIFRTIYLQGVEDGRRQGNKES